MVRFDHDTNFHEQLHILRPKKFRTTLTGFIDILNAVNSTSGGTQVGYESGKIDSSTQCLKARVIVKYLKNGLEKA